MNSTQRPRGRLRLRWLFQGSVKISNEGSLRLPKGLQQALDLVEGVRIECTRLMPGVVHQAVLRGGASALPGAYVRPMHRSGRLHLTVEFLRRAGFTHGQQVYLQAYRRDAIYLTDFQLDDQFLAAAARNLKS